MRYLMTMTILALLAWPLALAYLIIRIIIEAHLRRRRRPVHMVPPSGKYWSPEHLERFEGRMEEHRFAIRNRGVTIL